MQHYGLAAHGAVRWLIASDSGVMDAIKKFIAGEGLEYVDVVGPPEHREKARAIRYGHKAVPMPVVRLNMRMARNAKTDEPGVEVKVSVAHLEEIKRWRREGQGKAQ